MVNDSGQLYTIEGVAAAILMVLTAYLVLSTTHLYTQGDTHIADMQLEQLGNDALRVMDTPNQEGGWSNLEWYVISHNQTAFNTTFLQMCNTTYSGRTDKINYNATIVYSNLTKVPFANNSIYYRENSVKVTRWVRYNDGVINRTALLEVLLWRN